MTKLVFLDRDGVLVRFPGRGKYVTRLSQVKPIRRSAEAVALLTKAGFDLVVISNQGCVSRGMITKAQLKKFTERMLGWIKKKGGKIRRVFYCPHQSSDGCLCKKPETLMMEKAVKGRKISRRGAFFIGDSAEDVEAAKRFGCRSILVLSGGNKKRDIRFLPVKPDFVKNNLWDAAKWLTQKKS